MTNLTDRMARIAWITHRDRQLAQLGMKPSEYAADIPIPDWAYTLADAVIAELGLHQESGLSGYHVTINPGGYHKRGTHVARYCTEWTADD